MHTAPLHFHLRRKPPLARWGDWLARHRRTIWALQWIVVGVYAALLVVPAFLPLPQTGQSLVSHLTLAAQFIFWGLWWPGVILSTVLFGRVWCGLLCPEGALAEFASRHGQGRPIPRWLRWRGWPVLAFVLTTLYGQLISVYEYPKAALLVLGGSTVAAVAVGLLWGRGKRVWCRYLCPVTGVFALLARLSPLHYRVDREAWFKHQVRPKAVDCAPLLNVGQLDSAAQCHACGRCSGHRDAVQWALRPPGREIARGPGLEQHEAWLLIFGVLGVAVAAFQWSASPFFVWLRQQAVELAAQREWWGLLADDLPWWVLTHYPEVGDSFIRLDGLLIPAYILTLAALLGGALRLSLAAVAHLSARPWQELAVAWVPLGAAGLLAGLSLLTQTQLRAEGVLFPSANAFRLALLAAATLWSLTLLAQRLGATRCLGARRVMALGLALLGMLPLLASWALQLKG